MSKKLTDISTISGTGSSSTQVLVQSGGTLGWADRDDVVSDLVEATEAATEALATASASGTTVAQTYAEELYAYGVEWDVTDSDPTVTRIGNTSYHKTLPVQSLMKGCLLADDGTVNAYLGATDWTSYDRTGASGQVMVEIPAHYRKFVTDGDTRQVWISLVAIEGYHLVPKMYISAYEAALDRTNLVLCSVLIAMSSISAVAEVAMRRVMQPMTTRYAACLQPISPAPPCAPTPATVVRMA